MLTETLGLGAIRPVLFCYKKVVTSASPSPWACDQSGTSSFDSDKENASSSDSDNETGRVTTKFDD